MSVNTDASSFVACFSALRGMCVTENDVMFGLKFSRGGLWDNGPLGTDRHKPHHPSYITGRFVVVHLSCIFGPIRTSRINMRLGWSNHARTALSMPFRTWHSDGSPNASRVTTWDRISAPPGLRRINKLRTAPQWNEYFYSFEIVKKKKNHYVEVDTNKSMYGKHWEVK